MVEVKTNAAICVVRSAVHCYIGGSNELFVFQWDFLRSYGLDSSFLVSVSHSIGGKELGCNLSISDSRALHIRTLGESRREISRAQVQMEFLLWMKSPGAMDAIDLERGFFNVFIGPRGGSRLFVRTTKFERRMHGIVTRLCLLH